MPRSSHMLASSALALVMGTSSAFADLTAAEAWGDWVGYMQGMGYALTAEEVQNGNTLNINNINVAMPLEEANGQMTLSLGDLTFVENGNGTVDVVFPQTVPIVTTVTSDDATKSAVVSMKYTHDGMKMTMSGTPDDLTYDTSADRVTVSLDGVTVDGKSFGENNAKFLMQMSDLQSTSTMKIGGLRNYQQDMRTGAVSYEFYMKPPEENGSVDIKGAMAQSSFKGGGNIPKDIAGISSMQVMLDSGFAFNGAFSFGPGSMQMKTVDPQNTLDFSSSSDGGTLNVQMGPEGMAYEGAQTKVSMNAQMAGFPFPLSLSMAQSGFAMKMPVTKSDTAQEFGLAMNLTDFTMSDMLWGIFDPGGQLPRDPATIALDLSGKAKLLFDLLDPKSAEAMSAPGAQPGEIESLSINNLVLDAVGARLSGTGDIAFDNTDLQTYPGMPKPVGGIDLSITGANGLIDKLVAMGIVQQEQAMGARMMMGLFAVPGDSPDSLKSKIEFNAEGQMLANGQRIK